MHFDLDEEEIEAVLESLKYSRLRISEADGTPSDVRSEKIARIERLVRKLHCVEARIDAGATASGA